MNNLRPATLLFALILTCSSAYLAASEAHACEPMEPHFAWNFPDDGDHVTPEAVFYFTHTLSNPGATDFALRDDGGNPLGFTLERQPLDDYYYRAHLLIPDEPLPEGTITIEYVEDLPQPFEITLEVSGDTEPLADPVPPEVEWNKLTFGEPTVAPCHAGLYETTEAHYAYLSHSLPVGARYEVSFERQGEDPFVVALAGQWADSPGHQRMRAHIEDVTCITASAILSDGTRIASEPVCAPQRCLHREGFAEIGYFHWEDASPCDEDSTGSPHSDTYDSADAHSADTGVPASGDDSGDDSEDDEVDNGGGCNTTDGDGSRDLLVVLAFVLVSLAIGYGLRGTGGRSGGGFVLRRIFTRLIRRGLK